MIICWVRAETAQRSPRPRFAERAFAPKLLLRCPGEIKQTTATITSETITTVTAFAVIARLMVSLLAKFSKVSRS